MSAGFPDFRRGIKIAFFQRSGTKSLAYRTLKRCKTLSFLVGERLESMSLWITSGPVALLLSFFKDCSNSLMVKALLRSFGCRSAIREAMKGSRVASSSL